MEFKQRALGFGVPDCDTQILTGSQTAFNYAQGAVIWDSPVHDVEQNAGVFYPSGSYDVFIEDMVNTTSNLNSNVPFEYAVELDSAELF